jgi:hypothetical protein
MTNTDYLKFNYTIIKELKKIPMLKSFEEKDIQGLVGLSEIREYKPGDLIFEEGSYDGCIYSVDRKTARTRSQTPVWERTCMQSSGFAYA